MWGQVACCAVLLVLQASAATAQEMMKRGGDLRNLYDEYPVASKRPALMLDRLLVVLQRALEERGAVPRQLDFQPLADVEPVQQSLDDEQGNLKRMNPQRRVPTTARKQGNAWQCYFNAVSCFGKKK